MLQKGKEISHIILVSTQISYMIFDGYDLGPKLQI